VPKRHCRHRAEWRLLRGKPAQPLPAHYQLECDYDTALVAIFREGEGDNPLYLCERHAEAERHTAAISPPDRHSVREESIPPVETYLAGNSPTMGAQRAQSVEVAVQKPGAHAPSQAGDLPTARAGQANVNSFSRGPFRDLAFGNPAKALVDETIWNIETGDYDAYRMALRQGKSATEAAQIAGGQLAVVHRKIHEYTAKIEALLSASKATISVNEVIHDVLEHETSRMIADSAMNEEEKDIAIGQLGGFQEWINRGLEREMTPLQAHRIRIAIGNRANWGADSRPISDEVRRVYRVVYTSIRDAVCAAVPDMREPGERLANLYAAKSDLEAISGAPVSAGGSPDVAKNQPATSGTAS
jgi:hypothetical protein